MAWNWNGKWIEKEMRADYEHKYEDDWHWQCKAGGGHAGVCGRAGERKAGTACICAAGHKAVCSGDAGTEKRGLPAICCKKFAGGFIYAGVYVHKKISCRPEIYGHAENAI